MEHYSKFDSKILLEQIRNGSVYLTTNMSKVKKSNNKSTNQVSK